MRKLGTVFLGFVVAAGISTPALGRTKKVDCNNPRQTISRALKRARPGTMIQVQGTCSETVYISVDGVTIDGGGTAVIDGQSSPAIAGVVTVDGAQRVAIKNITLQNAFGGLQAKGGAAVTASNVTVQSTAFSGIWIDEHSTATLTDCTVSGSAGDGIAVYRSSQATLTGAITCSANNGWGLDINGGSTATFLGPSVTASGNHSGGVLVDNSSSVLVVSAAVGISGTSSNFGLQVTDGSSLSVGSNSSVSASDNAGGGPGGGIGILYGGHMQVGGTVLVQNNNAPGLHLHEGSVDVGTGGVVTARSNAEGITIIQGSGLTVDGTILVENNAGLGLSLYEGRISVNSGGVATVRNNLDKGVFANSGSSVGMFTGSSTITGNANADLSLNFGSRALLANNPNNSIGSISADSTSIIQP